jgi:hypothetical protein
MHIVLSSSSCPVEARLTDRGEQVLALVPRSGAGLRGRQSAPWTSVPAWDDFAALADLALSLSNTTVDSVTTVEERCVRPAAFVRSLLGIPGQSWGSAVASTDKLLMKQRLGAVGVPVARSRPLEDLGGVGEAAQDLGWPVIVKPRRGMSVIGTACINSPAHLEELRLAGVFDQHTEVPVGWQAAGLDRALEDIPGGLIAEQVISVVDEFSCDILRFDGEELFALPARYPAPLLGASIIGAALLPSGHDQAGPVLALARAAADALHLSTGFAHVEVLLDSQGVWRVGEIALRPGGSRIPELLRLQHGVDIYSLQADLAMRLVPQVALRPQADPIAWVGLTASPGLVTGITPASEILRHRGVIAAEAALEAGAYSSGALGSAVAAANVFTQAPTVALAEDLARRAAAAWQVTTLPPVSYPADHAALA